MKANLKNIDTNDDICPNDGFVKEMKNADFVSADCSLNSSN